MDQRGSTATYSPLKGSEVRLVKILPGTMDEKLRCKLYHAPLEPGLPFLALSYAWGDPSETVAISLDGQDLQVTRNLHVAMLFIRDSVFNSTPGQVRVAAGSDSSADVEHCLAGWWIDAICINQADFDERAEQVQRMGQVYHLARTVVCWLGYLGEEHDEAVGQLVQTGCLYLNALHEPTSGDNVRAHMLAKLRVLPAVTGDLPSLVRTMVRVTDCSWFERIWVVQEAVLANASPVFMLGRRISSLRALALLEIGLDLLLERTSPATHEVRYADALALGNMQDLDNLRKRHLATAERYREVDRSVRQAHGLRMALMSTTMKEANEPHDLIYGILGLATSEQLPPELRPDYNLPVGTVFQHYAKFIIQHTGFVDILGRSSGHLDGYPTWVPDMHGPGVYPGGEPSTQCEPAFSDDSALLSVHGCALGIFLEPFELDEYRGDDLSDGDILAAFFKFVRVIIRQAAARQNQSLETTLEEWLPDPSSSTSSDMDSMKSILDLVEDGSEDLGRWNQIPGWQANVMPTLRLRFCTSSFFITDQGAIGSTFARSTTGGSIVVKEGDVVCAFKGGTAPFLLRPSGDHYALIGSCSLSPGDDRYDQDFFQGRELSVFTLC